MVEREREILIPKTVQLPAVANQQEARLQFEAYQQSQSRAPLAYGYYPTPAESAYARKRIEELKAAGKWYPKEGEQRD